MEKIKKTTQYKTLKKVAKGVLRATLFESKNCNKDPVFEAALKKVEPLKAFFNRNKELSESFKILITIFLKTLSVKVIKQNQKKKTPKELKALLTWTSCEILNQDSKDQGRQYYKAVFQKPKEKQIKEAKELIKGFNGSF